MFLPLLCHRKQLSRDIVSLGLFSGCVQVMALRKQLRVMEVELVQARLSGLAGGLGFGGGGGRGMGMTVGGGGASAKAYRDALEETAELRRYTVLKGVCHFLVRCLVTTCTSLEMCHNAALVDTWQRLDERARSCHTHMPHTNTDDDRFQDYYGGFAKPGTLALRFLSGSPPWIIALC